ncbi:hypothetical protein [Plasmopara halstedii]|uniref:RxLR-like protein n=1 Tax=Plasmopara halstedii TaxID=4781 RepID=A0A0P1ANZ9_PLAHL|nr:hypothetical protein [Plasmopara halstedii]CEG42727.1 hypothetical protein [Plasmopara halstedii]|eukprot:XP_024579096.1 hypothetical protein [Plasmopara halstedii]
MWRLFGLHCVLNALITDVTSAVMDLEQVDDSSGNVSGSIGTTTDTSSSTPSSDSNDDWHMKPVVSIQARVQGDAPVWNKKAQMWVSKFGDTTEAAYMNNLDSVNTASVEGALMFVQAEGINVKEQSVKCERKNKMQYIVFYELTIVQPTYGIKYYESHTTPEYGEFVAMDGGKCTDEGSDLSKNCKVYYGLDGELNIGPMVGSNLQASEPRAPYPGNYWFSYPGSCAQKLRAEKTTKCRAKYSGGLCAIGDQPDGEKCTFSYKILGYLNIDDLVGITKMGYRSYTEFCEDGGIEFKATNNGSGFEVEESIDFWKNPCDEEANAARTAKMVKMYNKMVNGGTVDNMLPLPSIDSLTSANPKCEENSAQCANAPNGCTRILYSQVCSVCSPSDNCDISSQTSFSFPDLKLPTDKSKKKSSRDVKGDGTMSKNMNFERATALSRDNNHNESESMAGIHSARYSDNYIGEFSESHTDNKPGYRTETELRSSSASIIKNSIVGAFIVLVASCLL